MLHGHRKRRCVVRREQFLGEMVNGTIGVAFHGAKWLMSAMRWCCPIHVVFGFYLAVPFYVIPLACMIL